MKTKIFVLTLCMLLMQAPTVWAFDLTQLHRLIALLNILDKEKKQLVVQRAIKKSGEAIKANTHSSLEIQKNVEELLRDVDEFAHISGSDGKKFNDVVAWIQISREITRNVSAFVNSQSMSELNKMIEGGASGQRDATATAQEIYAYFFDASSIESKMHDYASYEMGKLSETEKVLNFQTAMQKKKIATAMGYYRAADELYTQSLTLTNSLVDPSAGTPLQVTNEGLFRFGGLFNDNSDLADPFEMLQNGGGLISGLLGFLKDLVMKDGDGNKFSIGGNWPIYGDVDGLDGLFDGFSGAKQGLRMTVGERVAAQGKAIDMLTKAEELKEKADKLLEEAMQKTPLQQAYEQSRFNDFMRSSAAKMDIEM